MKKEKFHFKNYKKKKIIASNLFIYNLMRDFVILFLFDNRKYKKVTQIKLYVIYVTKLKINS